MQASATKSYDTQAGKATEVTRPPCAIAMVQAALADAVITTDRLIDQLRQRTACTRELFEGPRPEKTSDPQPAQPAPMGMPLGRLVELLHMRLVEANELADGLRGYLP